jgi:hypothetical protein
MDPVTLFLRDNWAVIAPALWQIVGICVVAFGAGFGLASLLSSGAHQTKDERIRLAEDRVADYKEKLAGRSPDEAAARIAVLEKRLSAVEPYYLSEDQLRRLHDALVGAKYGARITRANSSPRLDYLQEQLRLAFAKSGWSTQDWVTMGAPKPPNKDVTLAYNSNVPTTYVDAVRAAFGAAGIDYGEQEINDEPSLTFPVIWLASARVKQDSTA